MQKFLWPQGLFYVNKRLLVNSVDPYSFAMSTHNIYTTESTAVWQENGNSMAHLWCFWSAVRHGKLHMLFEGSYLLGLTQVIQMIWHSDIGLIGLIEHAAPVTLHHTPFTPRPWFQDDPRGIQGSWWSNVQMTINKDNISMSNSRLITDHFKPSGFCEVSLKSLWSSCAFEAMRIRVAVGALLACGLWSAAFTPSVKVGLGGVAIRGSATKHLIQRQADGSMLTPFGPVVTYAKALMDAAKARNEAVEVMEDVLMIKDKFKDEEWLDKLVTVQNDPRITEVQKAQKIADLLKPLKSSVMPRFIIFLAKKNRLNGIKVIMLEYVQSTYYTNSVTPVRVTSAQRLTQDQMEKIKLKMEAKVGTDVRLVQEVSPSLLGGLTLEWGYTDPDKLYAPTHGVDLSLKNILNKRAIQKGVIGALWAHSPCFRPSVTNVFLFFHPVSWGWMWAAIFPVSRGIFVWCIYISEKGGPCKIS